MLGILIMVVFILAFAYHFSKAYKKEATELSMRPFDSVRNWDLEVQYLNHIHTHEGKKEVEAECLEVFSKLPSWKYVKRWDPLEYDEREAFWAPQRPEWLPREEDRDNELARYRYALRNVHREVAMCVFMVNRGYLPQSGLNCCGYEFEAERCGARTSTDVATFASMQKELLLWARDKIRSYDIEAELLCHIRPRQFDNDGKEYTYDFNEKTDIRNHPRGILSTVVLGDITGIRDSKDMGHTVNQKFHALPYQRIRELLSYKLAMHGISLIMQDEMYTSQCSPLAPEVSKTYATKDMRIHRGLYKDGNLFWNADTVGAYNILRLYLQGRNGCSKVTALQRDYPRIVKVAV